MAVVRPELTVREAELVLAALHAEVRAAGDRSKEMMKLIRVFEREHSKGKELEEYERKRLAKTRRMVGTAKEDVCPECLFAPPRHAAGCVALQEVDMEGTSRYSNPNSPFGI